MISLVSYMIIARNTVLTQRFGGEEHDQNLAVLGVGSLHATLNIFSKGIPSPRSNAFTFTSDNIARVAYSTSTQHKIGIG